MKKVISLLLALMMLLSISAVCTSAYTLPEGYAVSAEEGTAFDSVDGVAIGYIGDADESQDISIKDATAIQKHIAKLEVIEGDSLLLADVDFSTDITIKDATAIQKWIAKITVDEPVYHLLYQCEATPALSVVGTWKTTSDMAEAINALLVGYTDDPLMLEHLNIDTFVVDAIQTYNEDGTCTTVYDRDSVEESVVTLKADLKGDMTNYINALIKQEKLPLTVDQLIAFMGYTSMDAFINDIISPEMIDEISAPINGTYRVENDKLYMTAEGEEENYYENFTLTEDTLTFTSNNLGELQTLYPMVFRRVK